MRDSNWLLIQLAMLDIGIIPYASARPIALLDERSMNLIDKRIASLDPADRRTIKRKFRKLWRKAVRQLNAERKSRRLHPIHDEICGLHSKSPTQRQKQSRRAVVIWLIRQQLFENK